ncbi:hypothetical protein [Caenibius sp. WL]|nr:hypothetical protein [Caenibius sp. WL]QZP07721.1 hypothetical protein K5X80_13860 [Caenibius sp. WL]
MVEVCSLIHGELTADDDVGVTGCLCANQRFPSWEHRQRADFGNERIYQ